jgi:hypothetical protein
MIARRESLSKGTTVVIQEQDLNYYSANEGRAFREQRTTLFVQRTHVCIIKNIYI